MNSYEIFILTSEWRDQNGRNVILLYGVSNEIGPVQIIIDRIKTVFFIPRDVVLPTLNIEFERKEVQLKSFDGQDIDALYFSTNRDLKLQQIFFTQIV